MNKRHPYNNIIERKLEQLPVADADLLWNDMHSILDKKMPQKKERRRFIWWFFSGKGLSLLTVIFLAITASSLFFSTTKKGDAITTNKMARTTQSSQFIDNDAKVSRELKENITTAGESNQKNRENIPATTPAASTVGHKINNSFIAGQTIKTSKEYTVKDAFNVPIQPIANATAIFEIAPVNLNSINRDFFIATEHNRKLDSLIKQAELMSYRVHKNKRINNRGFYTGIISGVDLSSINFRSVKTGSTKGFIIGYAFNNKWSVESGFFWDTKRVYDNGSHFSPPGYTVSSGVTITAVNGKSRLYEFPLNMKYTIVSGKHNLFATTGLSSYFMRSENYDYEYWQNNQPAGHNYLSYKNETKNWFSVVNFSAGYTYKLGEIGSLRVESYLKLPIKNLGVGKMPIMSTGLNVGFTKPIR